MDASTLPELAAFSQHTTVHIDPAQLDKFWKAYTPVFEKTSACPECLYFEVLEDPDVAGKITWIVNWDASPQWVFGEHLQKDYYQPYFETVQPLFTAPFEIRILKREKPFIAGKKSNFTPAIGEKNEGISFHVSVEIQPEKLDEFKGWWRDIFSTVAAEEECLYFEVYSDPANPAKLCWMENWSRDAEWIMNVQLAKEYYKPYLAATEPMFAAERKFTILKRKEGFIRYKEANFEGGLLGGLGA